MKEQDKEKLASKKSAFDAIPDGESVVKAKKTKS
jgi:hypothetical protein